MSVQLTTVAYPPPPSPTTEQESKTNLVRAATMAHLARQLDDGRHRYLAEQERAERRRHRAECLTAAAILVGGGLFLAAKLSGIIVAAAPLLARIAL